MFTGDFLLAKYNSISSATSSATSSPHVGVYYLQNVLLASTKSSVILVSITEDLWINMKRSDNNSESFNLWIKYFCYF